MINNNIEVLTLKSEKLKFDFLPSGDIYQILMKDILVNQYVGNSIDGSINNIFLRVYEDGKKRTAPLLGIHSNSVFSIGEEEVAYEGDFLGVKYNINLTLKEDIYFYNIELDGNDKEVDLIYGQDLSLAQKAGTLTNELYVSQYLGHSVFNKDGSYILCSRQNMEQNGRYPYSQMGAIGAKVIKYSTDAMQFFGKQYKLTNEPIIMQEDLPETIYQFEMGYIGLQTEKLFLKGKKKAVTFYGCIKENHETAVREPEYQEEISNFYKTFQKRDEKSSLMSQEKIERSKDFGLPLISLDLEKDDIDKYFPARKLLEEKEGKLLSFFTDKHSHVVLKDKELLMERPHGHIILTGINKERINEEIIASTNFIYGVFNSQLVVGNTSSHKLLSVSRGLLNIFKNSGQRIYINHEGSYHLLALPSLYEMGLNYSRWFYKLSGDIVIVTVFSSMEGTDITLVIESEKGIAYEFIITQQLVMGEMEFQENIILEKKEDSIMIMADENNIMKKVYPDSFYEMKVIGTEFTLSDDRIFFKKEKCFNPALMTIKTNAANKVKVVISGYLKRKEDAAVTVPDFLEERDMYIDYYSELMNHFFLKTNEENQSINKLNEILWWYSHNAMIHFISPHGIEQPGGAAWGTRDVCQGPFEYFMAMGHFKLARAVILRVYENQFLESGEWPQWFMFDSYNIRQFDSHGDVVLWPLKILGEYLRVTEDFSILDEQIHYHNDKDGSRSLHKESLFNHMKGALKSIEDRFIKGTSLISYAGGDWDDTLQPISDELKKSLVSSWTVALTYQILNILGKQLKSYNGEISSKLSKMAENIKGDFNKYLIRNGIIPGFVRVRKDESLEYMLHPEDRVTGISYRLLPMIRSIISELASKEQADKNLRIIDDNLMCPDGVRLMSNPANYKGGVSTIFKRAEQAANVGREIGLMYVHAHIRYIEAMAKLGLGERGWDALETINPILIQSKVKNAELRQSNCYFSSSDADFNNRYDFQENYNAVKEGEIGVKGGWRIYSSGPGIYINQLITKLLGVQIGEKSLILSPTLPKKLNGMSFNFDIFGKKSCFKYNIGKEKGSIYKVLINGFEITGMEHRNIYGKTEMLFKREAIEKYIVQENIIEIYIS
ncbi:GH36-type glycosyl hydrolase domain-containing protein [Clostridium polynesiense]|uniref:GH36-type glycosyl hydrolase domain-containing protein n=1 Tax=Clostridium polynesiense TaxID=1325933 RepID=UPI00058ACCE3|nr:amylo-alpha-1,6-glucosidase [Clostridium polynesiense]